MPESRAKAKTFDAVPERSGDSLNWVIIRIPFDAAKLWGKRGQLRVIGDINGFPFQSTLFPTGQGTHFLIVNKKMQAGGKIVPGSKARFRLEPDTTSREEKTPPELMKVFKESKRLHKFFDSLSFSIRNWIAKSVAEGKQAETRRRRAEQIAVLLMETIEAERELPPVIRMAIALNPKAQAGWKQMSPRHRRGHLMSIFHYRNPESRARRIAKAVQEMVEYAEKGTINHRGH